MIKKSTATCARARLNYQALIAFALISLPAVCFAQSPAEGVKKPVITLVTLASLLVIALMYKASKIASATLLSHFYPTATQRASDLLLTRPAMMFFLGIADIIAALVVLSVLGRIAKAFPPVMLLFLFACLSLFLLFLIGSAGLYANLGKSLTGRSQSTNVIWGGAALELAMFLPVLGQILWLVVFLMALGAGILVLFPGKKHGALTSQKPNDKDEPEQI